MCGERRNSDQHHTQFTARDNGKDIGGKTVNESSHYLKNGLKCIKAVY